jgi:hypothetical protein
MSSPRFSSERLCRPDLRNGFEAVKILNLAFFALVFSVSYRRKIRAFSIFSRLRSHSVSQAAEPQIIVDRSKVNSEKRERRWHLWAQPSAFSEHADS